MVRVIHMRITMGKEYSETNTVIIARRNIAIPLVLPIKRLITATGQVGVIPPIIVVPHEKLNQERYIAIVTDLKLLPTISTAGVIGVDGVQMRFHPITIER